jgi:adenylate cyclase
VGLFSRFKGADRSHKVEAADDVDAVPQTTVRAAIDFSALAQETTVASLDEEKKRDRLQKMLRVLTTASEALLSSSTLDETLLRVLDVVFEHLPAERGFVILRAAESEELSVRCSKSRKKSRDGDKTAEFSRSIVIEALTKKAAVLSIDAQNDPRFNALSIRSLNVRSVMAAPLQKGGAAHGAIYVETPLMVKAFDNFDLDLLSAIANHVSVAIEKARLRDSLLEQQVVRRRLERYHSPAVVDRIVGRQDGPSADLVADERDVSVLFADMVGFVKKSESMEPRDVASMLNRAFSEMVEVIFRHEGTLDKFIGDCVMAVFGAPFAQDDHARRAADAAIEMQEKLRELNAAEPGFDQIRFRIGVHSGRVIAGDVGSTRRSDYTVLGNTVNVAARIESDLAKPGTIAISESTRDAIGDGYETRPVGEFTPSGASTPLHCYELVGRAAPKPAEPAAAPVPSPVGAASPER